MYRTEKNVRSSRQIFVEVIYEAKKETPLCMISLTVVMYFIQKACSDKKNKSKILLDNAICQQVPKLDVILHQTKVPSNVRRLGSSTNLLKRISHNLSSDSGIMSS